MRKFQKQQLLDIITSLHILHQESKEKFEEKDYPTIRTALADSQEAAIQLGEAIERMTGNGTKAVECLEKYCEKLYQISIQLEEISAQKFYKSLEGILIKAENEINHIPVRKEIVFLPYKASMWDSLESVYLTAREDNNCDVYVVPIPYYDRRADGSLGELHYEGSEYPKDIVITDYRAYNLEERHPDVIYIHNPYDGWNNVTCLPEYYFCKNLRNFTDCLVYIPYFILDEIEPNDKNGVEKMKHFCFLPGVIYSHKVIVQSEKMRQIYINEYARQAKALGFPVAMKALEENIYGIGSPKLDKVHSVKKDELEIPAEWLGMIEKPDGSWKKIIFYNTSINALLKSDEKMLEKMQSVFAYFKEVQEDITLLWRPHPLIPNTIKSMRPVLWDKYKKIVERYRQENWGIYDDSSDMDRAIALSDGYYGDYSSIVHLYKETGKPILLQDVNVTFENYAKGSNLFVSSPMWNIENNKAWFVSEEYNMLFYAEMDTAQCEFEAAIPYKGRRAYRMTPRCMKCGDCIFCMPDDGECIMVYQCSSREFYEIEIDNPDKVRLGIAYFWMYEDKIFAFSIGLKKLIEIDISRRKINHYFSFDVSIMPAIEVAGTEIYSLLNQSGCIICFDMMKKESISYMLPDIGKEFYTLSFDGEKFWMSGACKEVYIWNREENTIETIGGFPPDFGIYKTVDNGNGEEIVLDCESEEYDVCAFAYSIAAEGYIWLIPCWTNKILYVNQNTYEVKALEIEHEEETALSVKRNNFFSGRYILEYVRENRYIGLYSYKNRCVFEIDAREINVKEYNYYFSEACLREVKSAVAEENTVYENNMLNLTNYFNQLLEDDTANGGTDYENAGINIHKEMMKY